MKFPKFLKQPFRSTFNIKVFKKNKEMDDNEKDVVDTKKDVVDIEKMAEEEWREFKFNTDQLGVIDKKSGSVLTVNSLLIGLSPLSFVFQKDLPWIVLVIATCSIILLLISVFFCLISVLIKWSTQLENREKIVWLRNKKERQLETSIYFLFAALASYGLVFMLNTILRISH